MWYQVLLRERDVDAWRAYGSPIESQAEALQAADLLEHPTVPTIAPAHKVCIVGGTSRNAVRTYCDTHLIATFRPLPHRIELDAHGHAPGTNGPDGAWAGEWVRHGGWTEPTDASRTPGPPTFTSLAPRVPGVAGPDVPDVVRPNPELPDEPGGDTDPGFTYSYTATMPYHLNMLVLVDWLRRYMRGEVGGPDDGAAQYPEQASDDNSEEAA